MKYSSTKVIVLGSTAFRQPKADSHCRFIHGYNLYAKFYFSSDELDKNNWVVDFGSLKKLKKILKEDFDHKLIVSKKDPYLEILKRLHLNQIADVRIMEDISIEMFAQHCLVLANKILTNHSAKCYKCEVFEHDKNSAIYELEN